MPDLWTKRNMKLCQNKNVKTEFWHSGNEMNWNRLFHIRRGWWRTKQNHTRNREVIIIIKCASKPTFQYNTKIPHLNPNWVNENYRSTGVFSNNRWKHWTFPWQLAMSCHQNFKTGHHANYRKLKFYSWKSNNIWNSWKLYLLALVCEMEQEPE